MIHRFRVSNFRSIRGEVELDFRVAGTAPEIECLPDSQSRDDIRLPAVVAFIGPNGSGKTTLLNALFTALHFANASYGNPESQNCVVFAPFFSTESFSTPTRVEIDLDVNLPLNDAAGTSDLLRYTIEISREGGDHSTARVSYEALRFFPKGRSRRLLERCEGRPVYVSRETGIRPKDDRLKAISRLTRTSAISALAAMGAGVFPDLKNELGKFGALLGSEVINDMDERLANYYSSAPHTIARLGSRLPRWDLGISEMQVTQLENGKPILAFAHRGLHGPVVLQSESSGTRQLVRAFPLLDTGLAQGQLMIFDGLDSDLHTDLALEIINWFRREETNPNKAQLLCSLHNTDILEELEKEEAVIVEKTREGATEAYIASEISGLRRGGNLRRQYRSGVMGGLPVIG